MEPITLAALTSAVVVLASDVARSIAKEAGKDAWNKIKSILRINSEPPAGQLAEVVARQLQASPASWESVIKLLQTQAESPAAVIARNFRVEKGTVTIVNVNSGTINQTNTFS